MKINNIALVAHDSRKHELMEWAEFNKDTLSTCRLYATGTTGKMLLGIKIGEKGSNLDVICLLSGPLGGDQQIGAMIASDKIDMLVFFCDNLTMQGHQNDVEALSRLASLYNIPFATNRATADMLLTSTLLDDDSTYERKKPEFSKYLNRKV